MRLGYFTMPIHPDGAQPHRDPAGGPRGHHPRGQARLLRRLRRRAPHREDREHHEQHAVPRDAHQRHENDQARDRHVQSVADASGADRLARRDVRPSRAGPLHLRHQRRRAARATPKRSATWTRTATRCSPRRSTSSSRSGSARRRTTSIFRATATRCRWRRRSDLEIGRGHLYKPYQKPRPEIVGTVVAPFSKGVIAMGERDFHPLSANFLLSKWLPSHWANYSEGKRKAGQTPDPADWRIARTIFVADDDKVARRYATRRSAEPVPLLLAACCCTR